MKAWGQRQDFGKFLIQRFLIFIVGIMGSEMALMIFYNRWLLPYLSHLLQWNTLGTLELKQMSMGSLILLLVLMVISGLTMLLPRGIGVLLQQFFIQIAPDSWQQTLGVLQGNGGDTYNDLVYIGYFVVGILLLIVLMAPFAIGALLYSRMVRIKVKEFMEEDQRRAKEEQHRRNLLLSDIAHDLKTPMTTVSGYVQALNEGVVEDPGKQRECFNAIVEKTKKMNSMVELLLDYARLESGGLTLQLQKVDVAEWLRSLVAEFYDELEQTAIEPLIDIPEEEFLYYIDPLQFGRVVMNLVNNARKHMENGTHILIRLCHAEGRDGFCLIVGDDGIPIPEHLAEHLFEPFVMGDASRNSRGGSGLGLSIAAQITKLHGGRIWLDSVSTGEYTKAFVIEM